MRERNAYNKIAIDSKRTNQRLPVGRVKGAGKDSSLFFLIQYLYVENKKTRIYCTTQGNIDIIL